MTRTCDARINLWYRHELRTPFGYGTAEKSLYELTTWLLVHHHPEYVRRLVCWLDAQDGHIGVGGGWRAGGAQPDRKGFAPEGKSFHQDQDFNDGFTGAAAVDLVARNGNGVHRSPAWAEVPAQHSDDAKTWGVHCNVGRPGQVGSEPWHMQPIEIDGWQTWWNAGRPSPRADYPIPAPAPEPNPDPTEDPMIFIARSTENAYHLRRGDGSIATVLRSSEYKRLNDWFPANRFRNPITCSLIESWADIPTLDETDLDLLVGYPDWPAYDDDEG